MKKNEIKPTKTLNSKYLTNPPLDYVKYLTTMITKLIETVYETCDGYSYVKKKTQNLNLN